MCFLKERISYTSLLSYLEAKARGFLYNVLQNIKVDIKHSSELTCLV